MFLRLIFNTNDQITIELFDYEVIRAWFEHFKNIQQEYHFNNDLVLGTASSENEPEIVIDTWNMIKRSVDHLKSLGLHFSYPLPDQFTYDQYILNDLHRFFTYNNLYSVAILNGHQQENMYTPSFEIPESMTREEWFYWISKINDGVHRLEQYLITDNQQYAIENHKIRCYDLTLIKRYVSHDVWFSFEDYEAHHPESFIDLNYKYHDHKHEEHLVMLDQSILGKSVIRSFFDDDDPTQFDCTGRLGSNGGFMFDVGNNRKELYDSQVFRDWCKKYNATPETLPLEYPIGKIISSTIELNVPNMHRYLGSQVTVEFLSSLS